MSCNPTSKPRCFILPCTFFSFFRINLRNPFSLLTNTETASDLLTCLWTWLGSNLCQQTDTYQGLLLNTVLPIVLSRLLVLFGLGCFFFNHKGIFNSQELQSQSLEATKGLKIYSVLTSLASANLLSFSCSFLLIVSMLFL